MRYRCLACGHEFDVRVNNPMRRQCSNCGRRRVIESEKYANAIKAAEEFRRNFPLATFEQTITALDSLRTVIDKASPAASLASAFHGEFGDALLDPFITARVGWDIWCQAGKNLYGEKEAQENRYQENQPDGLT
jgi:DNA-directed RNA polymerase subunit RPC12/RpoP